MMKLLTMSNRKERFVFEILKAVNAKYMSYLGHIILKSLQWASYKIFTYQYHHKSLFTIMVFLVNALLQ